MRTTRELVTELRRAEFDDDFFSPVIAAASRREPYHLFWDDIDKLKLTDFKTEVLFDLVDNLYRQKHGLTVTGNYSMQDLIEHQRMHPAIVRLWTTCTGLLRLDENSLWRGFRLQMKPGDSVVWLRSLGRSILTGRRVAEIPAIVVRVCSHRIKIKVFVSEREKTINVDPDNLISFCRETRNLLNRKPIKEYC